MEQVRLDMNESPFDLPEEIKRTLVDKLMSVPFNRYPPSFDPGEAPDRLIQKISEVNGVDPAMIVPGNGSDELILVSMLAFTRPGGRVIVSPPTFTMYSRTARVLERSVVRVPLTAQYEPDIEGLVEAAREPGSIVFICRPNNPTGNLCSLDVLSALLSDTEATVVVDEAYHEFSGETVVSMVRRHSRLCVLRTMSKAYGLASLRLGYMIAPPELCLLAHRSRQPFNVNALSKAVAEEILNRPDLARTAISAIISERSWLARELADIPGVTVYPSVTNFLFIRVPCEAGAVYHDLRNEGVWVRQFDDLPENLRITVGTRAANEKAVRALRIALGRLRGKGR